MATSTIDTQGDAHEPGTTEGGGAAPRGPGGARLAQAAGLLAFSVLLSRILGYVRDALISARFGQGWEADLFVLSFNIPDMLYYVIAGGAISSAFIPVFSRLLARGEEEEAWKVFSVILTLMVPLLTVLVLLMEVFAWQLSYLSAPGLPPGRVTLLAGLTRIILPAQICFFVGSVLIGTQNARHSFFGQAVGPLIYNLGIIIGGLALSHTLGIAGFSWGALAGAILGPLLLQVYLVKRLGVKFRPSLDFRHPDVVKVAMLALPVLLGLSLPQIDLVINRWFATFLVEGRAAALNLSNRLMQVPLGVLAQSAGIALLPLMTSQAAVGDFRAYRATLNRGLRSTLALTMPISAIMVALAVPITRIAYQRGKFTPEDTHVTAIALVFYSIGIFAWSAQAIIARGFYALEDTRTPVVVGTIMTALFIPMNWLLMKPLDHGGLALSTTLAATLHSGVLLELLRRRVGGLDGRLLAESFLKVTLASVVCGAAAWAAYRGLNGWMPAQGTLPVLLKFLLASAAAGLVYAGAVAVLRVEEAKEAWQSLLHRFSRRR